MNRPLPKEDTVDLRCQATEIDEVAAVLDPRENDRLPVPEALVDRLRGEDVERPSREVERVDEAPILLSQQAEDGTIGMTTPRILVTAGLLVPAAPRANLEPDRRRTGQVE